MVNQNKILKIILSLIIFIAILHSVSYKFYLYDELWWIDIVAHFLGGFWVALFSLWIIFFSGFFNFKPRKILSAFNSIVFIIVLFIGIAWEIFEFKTKITFISPEYWTDTSLDVVFDLLGAITASFYCSRLYQKNFAVKNLSNE